MNKKVLLGGAVSALLLIVLVVGVATVDWDDYTASDVPNEVPVFPTDDQDSIWDDNGELKEESLSYTVFEKYGVILLPLALLMFGAMVGGVCIAREEVESDDSN